MPGPGHPFSFALFVFIFISDYLTSSMIISNLKYMLSLLSLLALAVRTLGSLGESLPVYFSSSQGGGDVKFSSALFTFAPLRASSFPRHLRKVNPIPIAPYVLFYSNCFSFPAHYGGAGPLARLVRVGGDRIHGFRSCVRI